MFLFKSTFRYPVREKNSNAFLVCKNGNEAGKNYTGNHTGHVSIWFPLFFWFHKISGFCQKNSVYCDARAHDRDASGFLDNDLGKRSGGCGDADEVGRKRFVKVSRSIASAEKQCWPLFVKTNPHLWRAKWIADSILSKGCLICLTVSYFFSV